MNLEQYGADARRKIRQLLNDCPDNHEAGYLQRMLELRYRAYGRDAKADRTGTGRHSIIGGYIRHDTGHYGPAFYQTKKVHVPSILGELRWLLSGSGNVRPLQAEGIRIWDEWAGPEGDLGQIYGVQWRSTTGSVKAGSIDQIHEALRIALARPADSGNIVSAWNVAELELMALRPCHTLWQICIQDGKLDLTLYQRSADWFLGVPFNAASYTTLQAMFAEMLGLEAGVFHHYFGDTHLYANQLDVADQHLLRLVTNPQDYVGPVARDYVNAVNARALKLKFSNIPHVHKTGLPPSHSLLRNLQVDDIQLLNYAPMPNIVAPRAAV